MVKQEQKRIKEKKKKERKYTKTHQLIAMNWSGGNLFNMNLYLLGESHC